jgi:hypothetical protein
MADPGFQTFFEKVRNHQGAVNAMMRVGQVMKEKGEWNPRKGDEADQPGVDTTQPPSKMQMMKLAFDKDLREAATDVSDSRHGLSHWGRLTLTRS